MKKFFLSLAFVFAIVFGASADAVYTLSFLKANMASSSAYNSSWKLTQNSQTWTIYGFNNNQNTWDYVRCFGKSSANPDAYAASDFAIPGTITSVVINGNTTQALSDGVVNVYASATSDFTDAQSLGSVALSSTKQSDASDLTITLSEEVTDKYIKVTFYGKNTSTTNGGFQLYTITFNGDAGEGGGNTGGGETEEPDQPEQPSQPGTEATVAFVASGASYSGTGSTVTISNEAGLSSLYPDGAKAGATRTITSTDIDLTFTKNNSSNSQVASNLVRWYQSDVMTIEAKNNATITSISFLGTTGSYATSSVSIKADGADVSGGLPSATNNTRTWTGTATQSVVFTAGAQTRFSAIEVTYELGEAPSVATPSIAVSDTYEVTLTCETANAKIYYTTDGTEPTATSTEYTAAFALPTDGKTYTVKAIAILGEEQSAVAVKTVETPLITSNLSDIISLTSTTKFIYNGSLTFVYKGVSGSNTYVYLTDGTDYILCFGYADSTGDYNPGDTFTSLQGTFTIYNGLPEVQAGYTLSAATAGTTVIEPAAASIDDFNTLPLNSYVKFTGVNIMNVSGVNAKMTSGTTEVALYNRFALPTFKEGTGYTITGFMAAYNQTIQLYPASIESNECFEPEFSLTSGEYYIDTQLQITCLTEGATIVYSINDGELVEAEAPVTITLTEDMEIEAYATKEGYTDSEVVSASYTVKEVTETEAMFDFTSAEAFAGITCSTPVTYPGTGENVAVNDVEMTVGVVSLTFGGTGTNPAIYQNGAALRVYNNNTFTLSVVPSFTITNITFTKGSAWAVSLAADQPGSLDADGLVWSPAEGYEEAIPSVTFAPTAVSRIQTINVEYAKVGTGIEGVEVSDEAPAVYYNLQGVRVANPSAGLYIRVAGNTVEKVFIR